MEYVSEADKAQHKKAGRQFLFVLLAFFGVCCAVNGFFVYSAITTSKGVVTKNAYERGLHYNEILEEARRRKNEEQRRD